MPVRQEAIVAGIRTRLMARLHKQTLDGHVEALLLAVLEQGPNYGYAMVQQLHERSAGLLVMGEGTVYPVLHRLEEKGLIVNVWRQGDTGRLRKYYRLNPKGRRALTNHRSQWRQLAEVMCRVVGTAPLTTSTEAMS